MSRFALLLAAALAATDVAAYTAYGIVQPNTIVRFDTATPAAVTSATFSGIPVGETIIGGDFRPVDGQLYLVTRAGDGVGRLYRLTFGQSAIFVGTLSADPTDPTEPYIALPIADYGVDVNPVPDRIRIVSSLGTNYRVNPSTATVITDNAINPGAPNLTAVAYTNYDLDPATGTTLFAIDVLDDRLAAFSNANLGTQATVGVGLGVNPVNANLDIVTVSGVNLGFATMIVGGLSSLYAINLATGTATLVGGIGGNPVLAAFAVSDELFANGFE